MNSGIHEFADLPHTAFGASHDLLSRDARRPRRIAAWSSDAQSRRERGQPATPKYGPLRPILDGVIRTAHSRAGACTPVAPSASNDSDREAQILSQTYGRDAIAIVDA
jgi:hypothetical protein